MKNFWHRLNDRRTPLGKGFRTFYQVFIPTFLTSLLGVVNQVSEWASCVTDCEPFPDLAVIPKMLVSAFTAALPGVLAFGMNLREDRKADREIIDAEPIQKEDPQQTSWDGDTVVEARTNEGDVVGLLDTGGALDPLPEGATIESVIPFDEDEDDLELTEPVPLDTVHDDNVTEPPDEWEQSDAHDDPERFEGVEVTVLDEPKEV